MRRPYLVALALAGASCTYPGGPGGTLLLSNPGPGHVAVETVVTANADCNARGGGYVAASRFSLPPGGTRFIATPPGASVCWRIAPAAGAASAAKAEWNRTYTSAGALLDSNI
ncbi:MAG TPA: hypothetical protein VGR91_02085 [Stellaceae bacterium]|nr:hypothetical protein [Stellaceae bacterium]